MRIPRGNTRYTAEERPVVLPPDVLTEQILAKAFDAVFYIDVSEGILLCRHTNDPLLAENCRVRMLLPEAHDYWLDNVIDPDDRQRVDAFLHDRIFSGSVKGDDTLEFKIRTKAGQSRTCVGHVFPIGESRYLFCYKDVTADGQMRELLRRNGELEEKCRLGEAHSIAAEYTGEVILEWDRTDGTFRASPGFSRYSVSRQEGEMAAKAAPDLTGIHPEDIPRFLELRRVCSGEQTTAEVTVRLRTNGGGYRWTNVIAVTRMTGDNRDKTIYILQDINELVQMRSELSKSEEAFSQAINNILEGVVIFEMANGASKIRYVSDTALHFYGVSKEDYRNKLAAGQTPDEVIRERILSRDELAALVERGRMTFSRSYFDFPGKTRYYEAICTEDRTKTPPTYYAIFHETTEEHLAREREEWQREKYRVIMEGSDIAAFDYHVERDELICSFNRPPDGYREEIVPDFLANMSSGTLIEESSLGVFKERLYAVLNGEDIGEFELMLDLNGCGFELYSVLLFGVKDGRGGVYRIVGRIQSIQKERDQLSKMLRSEALVQIALSSEALFSAAFNTKSGERMRITGEVIPEELSYIRELTQVFDYMRENVHPGDAEVLLSNILGSSLAVSVTSARKRRFECRMHLPGAAPGEYRWVQLTYIHAHNEVSDSPVLYIYVMDIDEEKKNYLRMSEQAGIDGVTGLLKRDTFEALCRRERSKHVSGLDETVNGIVVLDMEVDESCPGYERLERREAAARELACVIKTWSRREDIASRFGDTRFMICMHSLSSGAVMRERVQDLRAALNRYELEHPDVTVYMGVARCGHNPVRGFREVYDQADVALCSAKENGGHQAVFYMDSMEQKVRTLDHRQVQIRTFGYFDVFVDQRPIVFKSAKAKELLALLVDRRGGLISTDEAIGYLWEDEPANKVTRSRYRKVAMRLKETLEEYGIADIIEVSDRRRRIIAERVQCDLFDYVSGKQEFSNLFSGNYLLNYSWAEITASQLGKELWAL